MKIFQSLMKEIEEKLSLRKFKYAQHIVKKNYREKN